MEPRTARTVLSLFRLALDVADFGYRSVLRAQKPSPDLKKLKEEHEAVFAQLKRGRKV